MVASRVVYLGSVAVALCVGQVLPHEQKQVRRACFRAFCSTVLLHGDIVHAPCDVFFAERSNLLAL